MFLLLSIATYLIGIFLIALVVMQRKTPPATIAWILLILFLPIIGAMFYLWFGVARVERRVERKKQHDQMFEGDIEKMEKTLREFKIMPEAALNHPVQTELLRMTERTEVFSVTRGNKITFTMDPETAFSQLERAIEKAKSSVHMEYYIFRRDGTGRAIRDRLVDAAKRGVEVRLLTDGVGSWTLGDVFTAPLREAGATFARFLPVTFLGRPWHINLRNHRKIAITDGETAFIGSLNIGDEYRRRHGRSSDFYDKQITCEGPIVRQLQSVFAEDWFFAAREQLKGDRYFPVPVRCGATVAQVATSGPDDEFPILHALICAAINSAERTVRIVSPYLIPDEALTVALRNAALRGVNVEIIVARHPPKHEIICLHAGRSYFQNLLRHGIAIHEYLPGFLHEKGVMIDKAWATVGTANIDPRSFWLNFEVNINLYSPEAVSQLETNFEENLKRCERIELQKFIRRPLSRKFLENSMRVFSPIL